MKLRSFIIAFLMLGSVLPVRAQDASKTADELAKKWVTAYNAGDAAAISAFFTKEGVFSPATATLLKGRDAIERGTAGRMKAGWTKETVTVSEAHQAGDVIWASGEYAITGSFESAGKQIRGRFGEVLVREGDNWHIAQLTGNAVPPK